MSEHTFRQNHPEFVNIFVFNDYYLSLDSIPFFHWSVQYIPVISKTRLSFTQTTSWSFSEKFCSERNTGSTETKIPKRRKVNVSICFKEELGHLLKERQFETNMNNGRILYAEEGAYKFRFVLFYFNNLFRVVN